ncbi:hypothetical protein THF1C08_40036 [Vibrio jasicida]|uniref:Uncharacterized protein n=1 Tax=Vibrio jasicida TaxID=766224 RepID=A0AAU9QLN4_9VIBR|nr:hypothetical protein THF1A12_190037 [Vibrio jasicida]CAH1596161.1 hypothetical protein THF1C08_40036 [Vibrio jasicida]
MLFNNYTEISLGVNIAEQSLLQAPSIRKTLDLVSSFEVYCESIIIKSE